ncbi:MAG: hypothetical protein C0594_10905, partial [Marinilabiliales bacterium]
DKIETIDSCVFFSLNPETVQAKYQAYVRDFQQRMDADTLKKEYFNIENIDQYSMVYFDDNMQEGNQEYKINISDTNTVFNISLWLRNMNTDLVPRTLVNIMQVSNLDTILYSPTFGDSLIAFDGMNACAEFRLKPKYNCSISVDIEPKIEGTIEPQAYNLLIYPDSLKVFLPDM